MTPEEIAAIRETVRLARGPLKTERPTGEPFLADHCEALLADREELAIHLKAAIGSLATIERRAIEWGATGYVRALDDISLEARSEINRIRAAIGDGS